MLKRTLNHSTKTVCDSSSSHEKISTPPHRLCCSEDRDGGGEGEGGRGEQAEKGELSKVENEGGSRQGPLICTLRLLGGSLKGARSFDHHELFMAQGRERCDCEPGWSLKLEGVPLPYILVLKPTHVSNEEAHRV